MRVFVKRKLKEEVKRVKTIHSLGAFEKYHTGVTNSVHTADQKERQQS